MAIHIGKIVQELIKKQGLKAKDVAHAVNVSESSLYKIYLRESIDIEKLIRLSVLLHTDLLDLYQKEEPLKGLFNQQTKDLQHQISQLEETLLQKNKRIEELEDLNSSQNKLIKHWEQQKNK